MKSYIFVDADNIPLTGFIPTYKKICKNNTVVGCDCIGVSFSPDYSLLEGDPRVKLFRCRSSKNSSDTWLIMLASMVIAEQPDLEKIIIFSSDRDFLPLIWIAAQKGLQVEVYKNYHLLSKNLYKDVNALHIEKHVKIFDCCCEKENQLSRITSAKKGVNKKSSLPNLSSDPGEEITDGMKSVIKNFFFLHPKERDLVVKKEKTAVKVSFADGMPTSVLYTSLKIKGIKKSVRKRLLASNNLKPNNLEERDNKFYYLS